MSPTPPPATPAPNGLVAGPNDMSPEARAEFCKAHGLAVGWLIMHIEEIQHMARALSEMEKDRNQWKLRALFLINTREPTKGDIAWAKDFIATRESTPPPAAMRAQEDGK